MGVRSDHVAWSADELDLLRRLAESGLGSAQTARRINDELHNGAVIRTATMVNLARTRYGILVNRRPVDTVPASERSDPFDWVERYQPVQVTPPSLPRATVTPSKGVTLVAGDMHFGTASAEACSVFVETARQLKPETIVLNGDLPDMLAVSKYPKDVRAKFNWTLRDEATEMHGFLRELEGAVPRTTRIIETEANHSGNGTASRWWRYLSEHLGPLMTMDRAEERMSYQAWWYPKWSRLQLVESHVVADDLLILHGEIVRKHAAYSARATMEKWWHSTMNSHTHRMGGGFQAIPQLPHRAGSQVRFYEIGCLCDLRPSYTSAPNWTNGFAIVREDGVDYNVELVPIIGGRAMVNTLGATVKAG